MTLESGKSALHDPSDDFEIDAEVLMDEHIPEGRDAPPGNLGVRAAEFGRKMADRFAGDLQIADDGLLNNGPLEERASPFSVYSSIRAMASLTCRR